MGLAIQVLVRKSSFSCTPAVVTCVVSGAIVLAVSALLTDVVAFIAMKYVSQLVPSRQRPDVGMTAEP